MMYLRYIFLKIVIITVELEFTILKALQTIKNVRCEL